MIRLVCVVMLLALPPSAGIAQSGARPSAPNQKPVAQTPEVPPADLPPSDDTEPPATMTPDDNVNITPLGPPDQRPDPTMDPEDPIVLAPPNMVPNPLAEPPRPPNPASGGRPAAKAPFAGQVRRGTWVSMGTATLQVLDKVNARVDTLVVKVGDMGHFGSLDITVKGCFIRPPDQPADATAFLAITDQRSATAGFTGWMVRSAPSMSMLAHPIYDVRVAGCAS